MSPTKIAKKSDKPLLGQILELIPSWLLNNLTRRIDFALFMVEALENNELIQKAPAIVGCKTPSALAHTSEISTDHLENELKDYRDRYPRE